MDRLFLDANVLFSAAYAPDSGLARLWRRRDAILLASAYVVEEAMRNSAPEAQSRLRALVARCERVADVAGEIDAELEASLPASDRPVLRAALAARATHLVSGDRRAFGPLYGKRVGGLLVVRPADYLAAAAPARRRRKRPAPAS